MKKGPTFDEVGKVLEKLQTSAHKDECRSCDCIQGFLVQLELDAADDVTQLTNRAKVSRAAMHPCLGCEPCPPAQVHVDYIRKRKGDVS